MRSYFPSRRNSCMLARYHATYSAVDRVLVGVLVLACGSYSYSPSPRRHQCLFGAMYRCILDRRKHANVAREVRTIRFEYEAGIARGIGIPFPLNQTLYS